MKRIIFILLIIFSGQLMAQESLQEQLDARKADFELKAPDHKKKLYAEGIHAVAESGIIQSAINYGSKAPDFTLTDATGKSVGLYEKLKDGPVVLTWYRGGWCPYCNITLSVLQQRLPEFQKLGANLIALTPELPDSSLSTSEKNNLEFDVLSDIDNKIAEKYGIVFELTPEVAEMYNSGFGLRDYNGNDSNKLPLAATYVIDTDGTVIYAFLDPDYRNRAEPDEIIHVLQNRKK